MALLRTGRRWRARGTFAGSIVCLFVIKSLFLALSPAFVMHVVGGDQLGASSPPIVAACGTQSADKAPTDERGDHSVCCILCNAGARDATADAIPDTGAMLRFIPADSTASMVFFLARVTSERPSGWITSWSSRAPPRI
jgi:hypothetical protein